MVTTLRDVIAKVVNDPTRIPPAIVRKILRRRWWIQQGDYITFGPSGFVAASSPAVLLARHNYETRYIRRMLGDYHANRSLEIGCGFGRLSPVLAEYSDQHDAIDINMDALQLARGCYPNLRFSSASVTQLPFPNNTFDLVCTWTVLQHLRPHLIAAAVREIRRVLRPEATLLLCEATRFPDDTSDGIWDRKRSFYEQAFAPRRLVRASSIAELDAIPGASSPGEVMFFAP